MLYNILAFLKFKYYGCIVGKNVRVFGRLRIIKINCLKKDNNIRIGNNVIFDGDCYLKIRGNSKLIIHDNVKIDEGVRIIVANNSVMEIGEGSKIMFNSSINAGADIKIGKNTGVSSFCLITSSSHFNDLNKPYMKQGWFHKKIIIGDDVQIGPHNHITPGTIIEDQAIVASRTLVYGHIKKKNIVGGNKINKIGIRGQFHNEKKT